MYPTSLQMAPGESCSVHHAGRAGRRNGEFLWQSSSLLYREGSYSAWATRELSMLALHPTPSPRSYSTSHLDLLCPQTLPWKTVPPRGNWREGRNKKVLIGLSNISRILMSGTQRSADCYTNKASSCWNQSISRCSVSTK